MKKQYVVLEYNIKEKAVSPIWGPFDSFVKAAEFAHDRIAMLCKEWYEPEDGFLFDNIQWTIRELSSDK